MDSKRVSISLLIATAVLAAGSAWAGTQLVTNGNFSAGNTGFTTAYSLTTMSPDLFQDNVHGIYAIVAAPNISSVSAYGDWTNISTDPSGGDGNVFVADGATNPNTTVWSDTVPVTPDTQYTFSFYGAEVSNPCCSNALLESAINGSAGTTLTATGSWQSALYLWNSGSNTSATLTLTDLDTSGPYNDFAVDDISFSAASSSSAGGTGVPEPATWTLMLLGVVALAATRRSVVSAKSSPRARVF
ncbi:MAG TPA: PEP-CTERM sorting domain-containing protein [Steroidobacteraceae bacterium]|nr:PEP-CTERM sorting domain-containing protein [Steroidobacteraceae bacterium]